MFHAGIGVEKNVAEAILWWRKAADQGLVAAQVDLAYVLRVSGNKQEALSLYFKLATEKNNPLAQHAYGYRA